MSTTAHTAAPATPTTAPNPALTRALNLDAVASGATGILLAGGNAILDGALGIPSGWLLGLGLFMLAYAVDVALVGARPGLRRFAPVIVVGNAAWVVASVLLVVAGGFELTLLGGAFVLAQAAVVAMFAVLQGRGLRS